MSIDFKSKLISFIKNPKLNKGDKTINNNGQDHIQMSFIHISN